MCAGLSVGGALKQGWKKKTALKKGRERGTVGRGGGIMRAVAE